MYKKFQQKTKELAQDGVTTVAEAHRHLKAFAKKEMADVGIDSHIQCPTEQDISNILSRFKADQRHPQLTRKI